MLAAHCVEVWNFASTVVLFSSGPAVGVCSSPSPILLFIFFFSVFLFDNFHPSNPSYSFHSVCVILVSLFVETSSHFLHSFFSFIYSSIVFRSYCFACLESICSAYSVLPVSSPFWSFPSLSQQTYPFCLYCEH